MVELYYLLIVETGKTEIIYGIFDSASKIIDYCDKAGIKSFRIDGPVRREA
jgi:hypothetical protein